MSTLKFHIPNDREKVYKVIRYPAGEIQVRLTNQGLFEVANEREEIEITANPIPDIVELAQLVTAIRGVKLLPIRLFLPYFPYARADRRFVPGDCEGLDVYMTLLRAIGFKSIWTFDMHNQRSAARYGIANMLPTHGPVDQIRSVINHIGWNNLVLIIPDEGAASRYELYRYNLPILQASKVRDPKTGALSSFAIPANITKYKKALIVDDICDGGGTFLGLGEVIHKKAPKIDLYLYVSHGIFSKGIRCLQQQFKDIFISDYSFVGNETQEIDWRTI